MPEFGYFLSSEEHSAPALVQIAQQAEQAGFRSVWISDHYHPWLETEVSLVSPHVVVLLGATAAQAVMGPSFRVTAERGKLLDTSLAPAVVATVHPSAILRAATPADRRVAMAAFESDLRVAAAVMDQSRLG